jgi:hypothetical protein
MDERIFNKTLKSIGYEKLILPDETPINDLDVLRRIERLEFQLGIRKNMEDKKNDRKN